MGQNSEQLHVHWQLPVGVGKDIEQMAQIRAERVGVGLELPPPRLLGENTD